VSPKQCGEYRSLRCVEGEKTPLSRVQSMLTSGPRLTVPTRRRRRLERMLLLSLGLHLATVLVGTAGGRAGSNRTGRARESALRSSNRR
jgi:hypothetical protein